MLAFGLVQGDGWEPPDHGSARDEGEVLAHRWSWRLPWRPLAWFALWCWLMALVPVLAGALGGLAGYGLLLVAFGLACWRLERFCSRQYWYGLREHKS